MIAGLKPKEWESEFFKQKIASLTYNADEKTDLIVAAIRVMLDPEYSDNELVECNVDARDLRLVKPLEDFGFRTVDSRARFITLIHKKDKSFTKKAPKDIKIRKFKAEDTKSIQDMVRRHLTTNKAFISRYKDRDYFAPRDASRYFRKWVDFSIKDPDSTTVVCENDGQVVAFFMFKANGQHKDHNIYKGILTVVDKGFNGLNLHVAMQHFAYSSFKEEEFYIDNTTQISNYPTVKNHIRSKRELFEIQLTMLWKRP